MRRSAAAAARHLTALVTATVLWAVPASAQEADGGERPEPCATEDHRAFDFWVGAWEVRNPEGEVVGENRISRVAGGCGLLEEWRGAGGTTGVSINRYDPDRDRWVQHWVGGGGLLLELAGGIRDGSMVLSGEREAEGGTVVDRITWTPMEGDVVRQLWELSRDGGESWEVVFDGRYHPKGGA